MQTQLSRSGLRNGMSARVSAQRMKPFTQARHVVRVAEAEKVEVVADKEKAEVKVTHVYAGPVDFEELADIIRLVNTTDIIELDMKSKRFNLLVRKKEAIKVPEPIVQQMMAPPQYAPQQMMASPPAAPAAAPAPAPASAPAASAPAPAAPPPPAAAARGIELMSPMGGTFYRSPAPGEPAFVKEGDNVKKGQVVGLVEAMKLMNEIEAECDGKVISIIESGTPITSGMPLMVLSN